MRSKSTTVAAALAVTLGVGGCESEEEKRAEERVEAEAEARSAAGLEEDLREIGAGEIAEFEREAKEGDHLGLDVYDDLPRTAESEDALREEVLEE